MSSGDANLLQNIEVTAALLRPPILQLCALNKCLAYPGDLLFADYWLGNCSYEVYRASPILHQETVRGW